MGMRRCRARPLPDPLGTMASTVSVPHKALRAVAADGNHGVDAVFDCLGSDFTGVASIFTHDDAHVILILVHHCIDEAWYLILAADTRHRVDDCQYMLALFFHSLQR